MLARLHGRDGRILRLQSRMAGFFHPFSAGFVVLKRPADVGAATFGTGLKGQ
jgi:hypothetical protein